MTWKNIVVTCWTVFFVAGCFLWGRHLFAIEIEKTELDKKAKKPPIVVQNKTVSVDGENGVPIIAMETP